MCVCVRACVHTKERERTNDFYFFINEGNGISTILFFYIEKERERCWNEWERQNEVL